MKKLPFLQVAPVAYEILENTDVQSIEYTNELFDSYVTSCGWNFDEFMNLMLADIDWKWEI